MFAKKNGYEEVYRNTLRTEEGHYYCFNPLQEVCSCSHRQGWYINKDVYIQYDYRQRKTQQVEALVLETLIMR